MVLRRIRTRSDELLATLLADELKAANAGNVTAMTNLGIMYSTARGVGRNYEEAVRWWKRAADQGDEWAMLLLGDAYVAGNGVQHDLPAARQYYARVSLSRNTSLSAQARKRLDKLQTDENISVGKALGILFLVTIVASGSDSKGKAPAGTFTYKPPERIFDDDLAWLEYMSEPCRTSLGKPCD
jgi:hypothetical protein